MGFLILSALALVAATVAAALVTGQRLGERRKTAFQLEMTAEKLRRQVADLEDDKMKVEGQRRALTRLLRDKRDEVESVHDELQALMAEDSKEIGVSVGLRQRSRELETVAA